MLDKKEVKNSTILGSIHNPSSLKKALFVLKKGEAIGVFNRGVCAIWGDGGNPKFYEEVIRIKGEKRGERPLATSLKTEEFQSLIDKNNIPAFLHNIFLDPKKLVLRTGSLCFIRAPIKKEIGEKLPPHLVSKSSNGVYEMQNWDPYGHDPVNKFLDLMVKNDIKYPAVTSMNISGEPEIVDQEKGIEFAKKVGMKMFLTDEKDTGRVKGSFTIISISKDGLQLTRDGHIPGQVFNHLLENVLDVSNSIPAKFPQIKFPKNFFKGISPEDTREKILSFIYSKK